jgi:copper chaperone
MPHAGGHIRAKGEDMMTKNQTVLAVQGMTCPSCVRHIDEALKDVDGVLSVEVQLREGKVLVQHDPGSAPVAALVNALKDAGYESSPARA